MEVIHKNQKLKTQFFVKLGFGSDLENKNYNKAALSAIFDAFKRNESFITEAFKFAKKDLIVDIKVGVQKPKKLKIRKIKNKIMKKFKFEKINFISVKGGLDLRINNDKKIIANAIIGFSYYTKCVSENLQMKEFILVI